ncbi:MAG: ABC transporter ATP-binding protein [Spirochaetes bacterium]|jgi:iron(III) transport system ATP-binding protein|nr:ABC transporter ATP-binding protein [Spirochaetota bacterium]
MSDLRLKGVAKRFGEKDVLAPMDVVVTDGSFVSLLGPSGCGKTTLLRLIAGLETPSAGEIVLGETVLYGPGVNIPPEKRRFGMVFQSYAVWPHMTVFENVEYPLKVRGMDRKRRAQGVMKTLDLVHMDELAGRYPHQLSGGQQQRTALARGLVMEPPVLLLDEPLSNLDARLRAEMRREIRDLHRALGITILYVTHDQREAFEMATKIVIINEGRIEQEGTPVEIQNDPAPGFVREFLSHA